MWVGKKIGGLLILDKIDDLYIGFLSLEGGQQCSVCDPELKLDEEQSEHTSLAHQIGFGQHFCTVC